MKLTIKLLSVLLLLALASPAVLLPGCGNDAVPDGSTITVNSVTLVDVTVDAPADFKAVVRYEDGTPIPYARIRISGVGAAPAGGAYQFYYYPGGSLRAGGNAQLDSPFEVTTNEFGVYEFSAEVFGPVSSYEDTIYISSGTATGTGTLKATTSSS